MDDCCSFERFFIGTEEEAEQYCAELNKDAWYWWEKFDWLCLDDYKK